MASSNGGFGPGLGISSSSLMGGSSYSGHRFTVMPKGPGVHRSHTSSYGSSHSERIQPHPSHYGHPRPNPSPGPVGTLAPGRGKWMIPLCHEPDNDVNTCCLGCWCPQILYGRTQYRLRQIAQNKDPLNLDNYKVINGPCATYMIVGSVINFDWTFIMLQHSRIRATYNIDGTTADDCCSAYACPNCTLMQDDREIRAREYKDGKRHKKAGTIDHEPRAEPDMQYEAPNFFAADEPIPHRGSLVREKAMTAVTGQNQDPENHIPRSEKKYNLEHSKHHHHRKMKGNNAHCNNESDASNGSISINMSAKPDLEDRDAILASRQNWRNQNLVGKLEAGADHALAACPGNGTRTSENQDPVTNRRTLFDYSEDASISQVRGKRVLKQLAKTEGRDARSMAANLSQSPADESVLVFYEDGDHPQRHSLADCARLRESTLGRTDTPHQNDLPAGWREEKVVGGNAQSEALQSQNLTTSPKVVVTEHLQTLDPQHILNDCAAENTKDSAHVKQRQDLSHSLSACTSDNTNNLPDIQKHRSLPHSLEQHTDDVTTTMKELARLDVGIPESIPQHRLDDCATVTVTAATNPEPTEKIAQHHLAECPENGSDLEPMTATTLHDHALADCAIIGVAQSSDQPTYQHRLTDCAITNDAQSSEQPTHQHRLTDCAITGDAQSSETCEDIYSELDRPTCKQALEQNESHTVTITVPQTPVIIVTTSNVLEEATGQQHDQSRSKSPEIIIISNDSRKSTEHKTRPSYLTRDHDGITDTKDGQQQLPEAAAALCKVLRAAAGVRYGKMAAEFKGSDPTVVDGDAGSKKSSHGSRSKAIGGKAQNSNVKL